MARSERRGAAGNRHLPLAWPLPFLLVLALAALGGRPMEAALLLLLVLSHEAAHLAVAGGLGCRISSLRLMPLGGVLALGPEIGVVPGVEAAVAVIGPLHHVILLILAARVPAFGRALGPYWPFFVRANLSLAFFNLLPIFPLDGGRLLRAAMTWLCGPERAGRAARLTGMWLSVVLTAVGLLALAGGRGPLMLLCGLYLVFLQRTEIDATLPGLMALLDGKRSRLAGGRAVRGACLAVRASDEVWRALRQAAGRRYTFFGVLDETGACRRWITEEQALAALVRSGLHLRFTSLLLPGKEGVDSNLSNESAAKRRICIEDEAENTGGQVYAYGSCGFGGGPRHGARTF
ncbi:MAG: site-2 protease family protein [Patescibacteria group bacterium]